MGKQGDAWTDAENETLLQIFEEIKPICHDEWNCVKTLFNKVHGTWSCHLKTLEHVYNKLHKTTEPASNTPIFIIMLCGWRKSGWWLVTKLMEWLVHLQERRRNLSLVWWAGGGWRWGWGQCNHHLCYCCHYQCQCHKSVISADTNVTVANADVNARDNVNADSVGRSGQRQQQRRHWLPWWEGVLIKVCGRQRNHLVLFNWSRKD